VELCLVCGTAEIKGGDEIASEEEDSDEVTVAALVCLWSLCCCGVTTGTPTGMVCAVFSFLARNKWDRNGLVMTGIDKPKKGIYCVGGGGDVSMALPSSENDEEELSLWKESNRPVLELSVSSSSSKKARR
jgi:hypothetical protein